MTDTTTQQNTYNGWSNRETWLVEVHTFFDHEQVMEMIDESIKEFLNSDDPLKINPTIELTLSNIQYRLANKLKDYHDEYINLETEKLNIYIKDFIADHKINWYEIASHYDEEIKNNPLWTQEDNNLEPTKQFDHSWND